MSNIWEEAKHVNEGMLNEDEIIKKAEEIARDYARHAHHYDVLPKEFYYPEDDGLYDDLLEKPLP